MLIGKIGGLLGTMSDVNFWLLHAGLMALGLAILIVVRLTMGHLLAPAYRHKT